jgi:hypothetical protein
MTLHPFDVRYVYYFQIRLALIEENLAPRINIEEPAPRPVRSSSAIARKDHARLGSGRVFESRPPTTNNTSDPITAPINIMRNLRPMNQLPEVDLRSRRKS